MPRIALGSIFHETNTFLKNPTPLSAFEILEGEEIYRLKGARNTVAGFLEVAEASGWEVVPTLIVRRMASGMVADEVVEYFIESFLERCPPDLDAIFLPLHGAMTAESYPDVEGHFLEMLHRHLKPCPPLFGVLDLHANFTEKMARFSNALLAYRENPHTDGYEVSRRASELLKISLEKGIFPTTRWKHSRHLLGATQTGTADLPMRALEAQARDLEERPGIHYVNILAGFAHADVPDAGLAYSIIQEDDSGDLTPLFQELETTLGEHLPQESPEAPVEEVLALVERRQEFPVVLAEPADNIGGGASGDNTQVLEALLNHQPNRSCGVILWDPQAVEQLQSIEIGQSLEMELGGKSGEIGAKPLTLEVELVSRSDGKYQLEDPHSHLGSSWGLHIDMGPCAVVRNGEIAILLTTRRSPPFDLAQWRSQGFDPENFEIINAKAAVAFRQAYEKIAQRIYYVDTLGPCTSNLAQLPYRQLKRPIWPLD